MKDEVQHRYWFFFTMQSQFMNGATQQGFNTLLRFKGVSPSPQNVPASPGLGTILPQFCLKPLFHADSTVLLNPFIGQKYHLGFCNRDFFIDRIIHVNLNNIGNAGKPHLPKDAGTFVCMVGPPPGQIMNPGR